MKAKSMDEQEERVDKSRDWNIPEDVAQFHKRQAGRILVFLNKLGKGNFYLADYFKRKIYSTSASTVLLVGHAKRLIEHVRIEAQHERLSTKERKWLEKIDRASDQIFYSYPIEDRLNLQFTFELNTKTVNDKDIVVRQKVIPFELDLNGHLWLSLVFIEESKFLSRSEKPYITNFVTGEKFVFDGKKFVRADEMILTEDEISILRCMANGMIEKQICELIEIPKSTLGRRKQSAFDKLGAKTATEAIYIAVNQGII